MLKKDDKNIPSIPVSKDFVVQHDKEQGVVKFIKDDYQTAEEARGLLEVFSEHNQIPIFDGKVENVYESDFLGYKDKCPLCHSPTENRMSSFAYVTQVAPRLMSGPAGYFCTKCSTVIIDDDIMRNGIDNLRYEYYGVFSIEDGLSKEPNMFKTYNGEKTIYVLTEDMQEVAGIVQSVHKPKNAMYYDPKTKNLINPQLSKQQENKRNQDRKKNKAAKLARKKNRK